MILKVKVQSWKTSDSFIQRQGYRVILVGWRAFSPIRLIFSPEYRSLMVLKYAKGKEVHQISNYTEHDRYPDLFLACQNLMGERESITILSFGCSTGEEVFTLRNYFPNATIIGVDINKHNIKKAARHNRDTNIHFSHHVKESLSKYGPFDIIFALAVFQRTENRDENIIESTHIYPFEKFNAKVLELDKYLKPNGLFVIDNSDYHFEDVDIACYYQAVKGVHNILATRNLYDKNNKKMSDFSLFHRIFLKLSLLE
jgi:SAM-dependent methyltransferase